MIIKERRRIICDICGKELTLTDIIYGYKFKYSLWGYSYPRHMCESCFDEYKKFIKERKTNDKNK